MTNDIFDIYFTDDLPKEIKNQLPKNCWQEQIIKLFILANRPLSIDEVMVGYYRKYGIAYNKMTLANHIWQLTKRHGCYIEKVKGKKGVYRYKDMFHKLKENEE